MKAIRVLGLANLCKKNLLKHGGLQKINNLRQANSSVLINAARTIIRSQACLEYSTIAEADTDMDEEVGRKVTLANNLASLLEETCKSDLKRPKTRMEVKRSFELRIKKKVKEQYIDGKFQHVMEKVIANPETLQEAFNCIKINANIDISSDNIEMPSFESMAEELSDGKYDVKANTFSISTKGSKKEVLVLPNLNLKVLQEAIKIVLEVIYKPIFSKISHGCRSGRGQLSALKYIRKEIKDPDWWFTININKKTDTYILAKLISILEEKIEDPKLCSILKTMFNAGVLNLEFGGFPKAHGLPQEGVVSPILMNIYLDLFDREFYRLSMKYEALNPDFNVREEDGSSSKLRSWFRRQLKNSEDNDKIKEKSNLRVYSCRFMDEIFLAISGSKDVALSFKSEILNFLQNSLRLDVDNQEEILPSISPHGTRFLGILIKRSAKEDPALKAVHKLKEKVELFALQKEEAWNDGTVKIGIKWLGHGLKKVKESEIKHLADPNSVLSQISSCRKPGMETDHWYKFLLKIWMQEVKKANSAHSEEIILSKYISEPSLPKELVNSFHKFQNSAKEYVSSETASTLALLPTSDAKPASFTEIIAPINAIEKRLFRYGLVSSKGFPRTCSLLILQDIDHIINWFSGIVDRWIKWYRDCDNFGEVRHFICDQVRKSCIRTLAAKYRLHESEIEKRFDSELSRIPSTDEIELEIENKNMTASDEALTYGISYSGLTLLSLARMVSESRPCKCFVMGCGAQARSVYILHVMERQRFPGWKTGFSSCIHPALNRRRIGLCEKHLEDLYHGDISLQCIDFGAWKK